VIFDIDFQAVGLLIHQFIVHRNLPVIFFD